MSIFEHLDSAIATFDTGFTTHELIRVLAKDHQRDYVSALAQESGEQPFKDLHAKIGKLLSSHPDLQTVTSISSINIFGDSSKSPVWHRI